SIWEDCAPLVVAEGLSARLPVLASRIGGIEDFIRDGVDGDFFSPRDVVGLSAALLRFHRDPERLGRMQEAIEPPRGFAAHVSDLQGIYDEARGGTSRSATQPESSLAVVWEGSQFVHHSLAIINREITARLIDRGHDLGLALYEAHQFDSDHDPDLEKLEARFGCRPKRPVQVHVRHQWPPNFTRPAEGRLVLIQPWEFGSIPRDWVAPMRDQVDEVWVPSAYVKQVYAEGGVPAEKIQVIPNGVDTDRFSPDAAPMKLATDRRFKFLFVGGTIPRKGIDGLLEAWRAAFRADDDVCLVIKDQGASSHYRGKTAHARILELQADPEVAEILHLEGDVDHADLPGLYTACDAFVHPYLGEGFGMPITEAMACELPVIVTGLGAAMDFCDESCAFLIPAERQEIDTNRVGDLELVGKPWLARLDLQVLVRLMRDLRANPDEARRRAGAARTKIVREYRWQCVVDQVESRLKVLAGGDEDHESATAAMRNLFAPALSAWERGRTADAKAAFASIIERHPDLAAAHAGLAAVHLEVGDASAARASLRRAVGLLPDQPGFHNQLGVATCAAGSWDEAEIHFRRALELDPALVEAWVNLAQVHRREGKLEDAARCALEAVNRGPSDPQALEIFARVSEDVGYDVGVERARARLEELQPLISPVG
ncbi:MAG: glycosyltransferase, partial [Planctomycetes bacterium]|nr:glycosyltransferase [Planctomycetota bacterium]